MRGFYFAFVGIAGTGKSTQLSLVIAEIRKKFPDREVIQVKEPPSGNPEMNRIRELLKNHQLPPRKEAELFAYVRGLLIEQIKPYIESGTIVGSDRCFVDSGAHQGKGRRLGLEHVWEINEPQLDGLYPDVIYYFNVNREVALSRSRADNPDKFDSEPADFWERTIAGYNEMFSYMRCLGISSEIVEIKDQLGRLTENEVTNLIALDLHVRLNNWLHHEGKIHKERQ